MILKAELERRVKEEKKHGRDASILNELKIWEVDELGPSCNSDVMKTNELKKKKNILRVYGSG